MSHFNHVANDWDNEGKIKLMNTLATKTRKKLDIKDKVDILDFGCGTGLFGLEFIEQAKSITGIDTSEGMLEVFNKKAANYNNIKSININLEQEECNLKVDLIVSSMTFHHLDNPSRTLKKLSSMLNPKGQLAIVDLEKEDGTFHPDNKAMGVKHLGFSNEEIKSWADEAGLKVELCTINSLEKNDRSYNQFLAVFKQD
jgi:tRNA (cmo5U34)-methyltransferase